MNDFFEILSKALDEESLLLLVLSKPDRREKTVAKALKIRPISLKDSLCYQMSSLIKTKEFHENLPKDKFEERMQNAFGTTYLHAHLCTKDADYFVKVKKNGQVAIKKTLPSHEKKRFEHNRSKNYLIPDKTPCPFLVETGVMNPNGSVRKKKYSKFRQINRFLELLNVIVPSLSKNKRLRIVDFGSGKSYLTFAVHHLFTQIHHRDVEMIAVDWNEQIIENCRAIAEKLSIEEISFRATSVGDLTIEGDLDLVISLHACDTATDDVLVKAIDFKAKAIFAVPCCHHELATTMQPQSMNAIMKYGILKEQMAALATDSLRAQILELHGYRTEVLEFIELEHTHKNLLIRGVKRDHPLTAESVAAKQAEFEKQKRTWGIEKFHLEALISC